MRPRRALAFALLLMCGSAYAAVEELTIKNVGISRTISDFGGPLRTIKLEANGVQVIRQPGVEFMIDLDYKGEPVSLAPGDFEITEADTIKDGRELRTNIRLQSLYDGIPLIIYLRYHRDPAGSYQQKSITILPCKEAAGAVLRRVILDDQVLKPEYVPVMPRDDSTENASADLPDPGTRFRFGGSSDFAAIDRDSKLGLFVFVTSLLGKEGIGRTGGLRMWEEMYVPVEKGYETGRAAIGSVAGPAEVLFKRFREFLRENYCAMRGKPFAAAGATPISVRKADLLGGKLPESVTSGKAPSVGLEGEEWTIPSTIIRQPEFAALSGCEEACRKLRQANRNLVISLSPGSIPPSVLVHWLGTVDCIAFAAEPDQGGLTARRLRYSSAFVFPAPTISCGLDVSPYLANSDAIRKQFAPYLDAYQHVLSLPDGMNIEGDGHIIGNKGLIVLYNPKDEPGKVAIPLEEPELELKGTLKLTDRTSPDSPTDLGTVRVGDKVEVEIAPSSAKVIGVNL